jgi:sugar (pentulose or hexulose) kinase
MAMREMLAVDLGASGGRGIAGQFDGKKLGITEINRFSNGPKQLGKQYYWDFIKLVENIYEAVSLAGGVSSIGVDTWGVDFGFLDKNGCLLGNPRSYRDPAFNMQNRQAVSAFFNGEEELFDRTYVTLLEYNSLCQLFSMAQHDDTVLSCAEHMLMMPNLIEYFLSGMIHSEYSAVSTTQVFDMKEKVWSADIIGKLGVNPRIFSAVDYAGKKLGKLKPCNGASFPDIDVISVAGHDTACAAVSVPSTEEKFTFISSGTWSLMGMISKELLTGSEIIRTKIGNEGAARGEYRPTVNINGLWIIQECKRNWSRQGKNYSFADIAEMARKVAPLKCFIDTSDFMNPGDYPKMIQEYCKTSNQYIPRNDAEIARCAFDSLAMKYKQTYQSLKKHMVDTDKIYIVGGGTKNKLLNQLTADALGVQVIIGPSEATVVGNLILQMEALGEIRTRNEAAEIIRYSFESEAYEPRDLDQWEDAFEKYQRLFCTDKNTAKNRKRVL